MVLGLKYGIHLNEIANVAIIYVIINGATPPLEFLNLEYKQSETATVKCCHRLSLTWGNDRTQQLVCASVT